MYVFTMFEADVLNLWLFRVQLIFVDFYSFAHTYLSTWEKILKKKFLKNNLKNKIFKKIDQN